jgi:exonuclease VII large subunit
MPGKKAGMHGKMKKVGPWAAAAAVLLLIAGTVLFKKDATTPPAAVPGDVVKTEIIREIDPEKAKEVQQFSKVIHSKRHQLTEIKSDHPKLYQQFSKGIQNLDSVYHRLEQDLGNHPNDELLLEAMLQNLQLQTAILNRQLDIIKKIKQKNYENEKRTL